MAERGDEYHPLPAGGAASEGWQPFRRASSIVSNDSKGRSGREAGDMEPRGSALTLVARGIPTHRPISTPEREPRRPVASSSPRDSGDIDQDVEEFLLGTQRLP